MAAGDKLTYQDVQEIVQSVAPGVAFQARDESSFLTALGFPGRLGNADAVKHEWLEERLAPNSTQIDNAGGYAPGAGVFTVDAGTGTRFVIGDTVQADGSREIMIVTGSAANTVNVTRGYAATTAVHVADDEFIRKITNPTLEKQVGGNPTASSRQRRDTYSEIFRAEVSVSNSRKKVKNLGNIPDEVRHQLTMRQREKIRDLAKAILVHRRHNTDPEGTDAIARTMDGIIWQIIDGTTAAGGDPAIVDAGAAALDIALLDQVLRECWERGGNPNALAMGATQLERMASLIEGRRRYSSNDASAGGRVNEYVSKFGPLKILDADVHIPPDVIIALDTRKARVMKLGEGRQPFDLLDQGKAGTSDDVILEGEFCLEAMNASDGGHGLLQNLQR